MDHVTRPSKELFGEIAVRRGFVSAEHVHQALKVQNDTAAGGVRKMIGLVLMDLGMLGTTELIEVLKEVQKRTARFTIASAGGR